MRLLGRGSREPGGAAAVEGGPGFARRRSIRRPAAHSVALGLLALAAGAFADTSQTLPSPDALKSLSLEELMELDVTSVSRQPERLLAAASAVQVVTDVDIRRSGAPSLPEALRLADNLEVAQKSSHDWGISARGFNTALANKLLVLIDGRTVYTPLFSGVFWNVQDVLLEDVERIEVVSGPGGAVWGANAVNGVINVTTKRAQETQGLFLEAGGGNSRQGFAAVRYGGSLAPGLHYRVYGKYFDRRHELLESGEEATDGWNHGQAGFRVDADPSSRDTLVVQGDLYDGEEEMLTGGIAKVGGGNLLGRWSRTYTADSDLALQLYYARTELTNPVPALILGGTVFAPAGTFEDALDTWDVDFQHRFRLSKRHRMVWGLGYRASRDEVVNAEALGFFPTSLDQHLFSGFVQDEMQLSNDLRLTLGSKVEHNHYTGLEVEPGIRLQWSLTSSCSLWAAVSRAVRTPSRIDRDLSQPVPPRRVVLRGDPGFKSETVIAHELGLRSVIGSDVAIAVSAFYNEYDDVRSTSLTPTTVLPFYFANHLHGETRGLELSASYRLAERWRLRGGYNLLSENLRVERGEVDLNQALNETADPQQQASLRSSVDLPGKVEVDTGLRWVDTLHNNSGPTIGTVPSYFELDLRVGWRPSRSLEISVVGQNLLHDRHPEYGFPGPARVEIGRSVYGRIAWRL